MNVFDDIKNGILPDENILLYLIQNPIIDEKNRNEIERYISILSNSFENASIDEKILLNRVLFILDILKGEDDRIKNFIYRTFSLNIHDVNTEYMDALKKIFELLDEKDVFLILKERIDFLIELQKEECRSFFNWLLHYLWNIPKYHNNDLFKSFYESLQTLIIKLRDNKRIDDMMYVEFFTYHIIGNRLQNIDEWREFNNKITKESIKGYEQFINKLPKSKPTKKKRKRIGFIKDRIVENSPFMVEYSLLKKLMNNKYFKENYEIVVYTFNQFEKSRDDVACIEKLEKIGVEVKRPVDYLAREGYYNNHLEKALTLRQHIIEDDIDIMIAGGVFPILNFLYVTRTAPLQIYYSHGNCAFDIPNIDKRISHFHQECKEFEWNIIKVDLIEDFLIGTEGEKIVAEIIKNDYKNKFGTDVVILGSIGRLVKIDRDDYIEILSKIMAQYPNTIYLACGGGSNEGIKEKLKKYNIDENRFLFLGQIKAHIYGWIIDLYLAPFDSTGQALDEYRRKYKNYVALHTKEWARKNKNVDVENMIIKELYSDKELKKALNKEAILEENSYAFNFRDIANVINKEDYLKVALRFLEDKELVDKVLKEYKYVIEKNKPNVEGFLKVIEND